MTPAEFTRTHERLGMSRAAFCRALGISRRSGDKYATTGPIPRYMALAAAALLFGLPPVGGEEGAEDEGGASKSDP